MNDLFSNFNTEAKKSVHQFYVSLNTLVNHIKTARVSRHTQLYFILKFSLLLKRQRNSQTN